MISCQGGAQDHISQNFAALQPVFCKVDVSVLQILAVFVPRQMVSKPKAPVSYVLIAESQPVENSTLATVTALLKKSLG